jgi:alkane 1-monooxygenase
MDYLRYYLNTALVLTGIAGFALGGPWVWAGAATFVPLFAADLLLGNDYRPRRMPTPWLADLVLYLHVALMVVLYATFVWRMRAGLSGDLPAQGWHVAGAVVSLMWLHLLPNGGIGHELAHRRSRFSRFVGLSMGALVGDPCRDIAHNNTHHLYFDTGRDTDTAHRGENVYGFMLRATLGSFRDTWESELRRARNGGYSVWSPRSRVTQGLAFLVGFPAGIGLLAGPIAAGIVIAALVLAKFVLEALNYLQHYGLVRDTQAPIGEHHTWNHLSTVIRIIGTEITNHVDHHRDAYVPYYQLVPRPAGACMPSIFLCFLMSFVPPLWFRFVKRKLYAWDATFASPTERRLAMEANRRAGWPLWLDETTSPDGRSASAGVA